MFQKTLTLQGNETIVLEWHDDWRQLSIRKDGKLIGSVPGKAELLGGRHFTLPDGKKLMVVLADYGLEVWYEGRELVSGTKSGASDGFGAAYNAMIVAGGMNIIGVVLNKFVLDKPPFAKLVFGLLSLIGLILIGLAHFTRNNGSKSPLWTGGILGLTSLGLAILLPNYIIIASSGYLLGKIRIGLGATPYQPTRKLTIEEDEPLDSNL